jgi:DNA-binding CsgD family transcriptional regulator
MSKPEVISRLTERQLACLELVSMGFTSKQIARKLGISHSTVDNHVLAATQLLGVTDRREAARLIMALRQQLPRQAPELPQPQNSFIVPEPEASPQQGPAQHSPTGLVSGLKLLPPVGGTKNEQSLGNKTVQILSLAFLSTLGVLAMALLISGVFKAFS